MIFEGRPSSQVGSKLFAVKNIHHLKNFPATVEPHLLDMDSAGVWE